MELINRTDAIKAMDELEQEDIEKYGCSIPEGFDGERARLAICLLPTIQAVPIEVLQEIRQEIDSHCSDNRDRNDGLYIAMKIIDKHISDIGGTE